MGPYDRYKWSYDPYKWTKLNGYLVIFDSYKWSFKLAKKKNMSLGVPWKWWAFQVRKLQKSKLYCVRIVSLFSSLKTNAWNPKIAGL